MTGQRRGRGGRQKEGDRVWERDSDIEGQGVGKERGIEQATGTSIIGESGGQMQRAQGRGEREMENKRENVWRWSTSSFC